MVGELISLHTKQEFPVSEIVINVFYCNGFEIATFVSVVTIQMDYHLNHLCKSLETKPMSNLIFTHSNDSK